jgi:methylmalonyl-CoA/ethylmalonyl-CoA epimerase
MSVPDPEKTAEFYCKAFDMERAATVSSPMATGCYVTDGVIMVALLKFKSDKASGYVAGEDERGKDFVGLHHIGFEVDELREAENKIEDAGGKYLMGRPEGDAPTTFFEEKFHDPNGVMVDISDVGWGSRAKK